MPFYLTPDFLHLLFILQGSVRAMDLDSEGDILYTCSWDRTIVVGEPC